MEANGPSPWLPRIAGYSTGTPPWLRDWPLLALNDIDQILFRLVKLFTGWGFAIRRSGLTALVTVKKAGLSREKALFYGGLAMCSEYPVEVHMDYPARVATKLKFWSPKRVAKRVAEANNLESLASRMKLKGWSPMRVQSDSQ